MPEITRIEKTFTYDLPDAYLYQTRDLEKTGTWTYKGPRYMWIFVDNNTNKIISRFHYTERDNGAEVPSPEGQTKVLIDADVNPIIAALIHNEWDYGVDLPQYTEELPDGSTYGHCDPVAPDHTYELTNIEYDPATGDFVKPYPWKQPHVSWPELINWRNNALASSDLQLKMAMPNMVAAWEEYRQLLRDLPTTFAGIDPWKVPFPKQPGTVQPTNPITPMQPGV